VKRVRRSMKGINSEGVENAEEHVMSFENNT